MLQMESNTHFNLKSNQWKKLSDLISNSQMLVTIATDADLQDYTPHIIRHFWEILYRMYIEFETLFPIPNPVLLEKLPPNENNPLEQLSFLFLLIRDLCQLAKNHSHLEDSLHVTGDYLATIRHLLEQACSQYEMLVD